MNLEEFLYLLPYLLSLALSTGVFIYAWQHRYVRGARLYSWFAGGQTLTILGFIFELISPNRETKILWDKFQWLTDSFLVFVPFLLFAVQFSEHKIRRPRLTWGIWIGIPLLFTLCLLTDSLHHWIYPNPQLSADYPFPDLQYTFTPLVYAYALVYVYAVNFYGISLLIKRAVQPYNLYRLQYWTIVIGFSIPLVLSFFSLANIHITPQRDISPFSLAIGNAVVAWGLFRFKIFDLVPIARERILENMADPMAVLDQKNRIVDVNAAALTLLDKPLDQVLGHLSHDAFARLPALVSELEYLDLEQREVAIQEEDDTSFYDLNISPIYNNSKQLIGRIVVAHDITKLKTLEVGYRVLSAELDQRVRKRTEELRRSSEQYRAVVEHQTEFIVRWKPDRTRTFVNEAYCRYFGLTREQALQDDFLSHIHEDDREAVLQKISRLMSVAVEVETDIHRVIKPDGSIGWQEWTDQTIRDEAGNVIEFQSIGRDITERKQAEEALRESEAIYRQAIEVAGGVPYRQSYQYYDGYHLNIRYDFIGEGIRQISGYGPDEITEALWDSLVQETHLMDELAKYPWEEAIQRVRTGKEPVWQCEYRIVTRSGETRWVYEVAVEILENDGISHSSIGLYQDITERKRAEEELRKLSQAVEQSNASIVITDTSGCIEYVNPYFSALTGYAFEEVIGKNPRVLQSGLTSRDTYRNLWQTIVSGQEWRGEFCNRKKNGELYWESASIAPVMDSVGAITHYVAVKTDITERKRAEEALRKSEERFSKAFQASPIIITISQINSGKLLEVNDAFEHAMGYARHEVLGKTAAELELWVNPADRERIMRLLQENGRTKNEELQFRTKRGSFITCNYSAELIEIEGERCLLAIVEDITERKKSEARILRLNRLYVTISQINQTIVHARTKENLFLEICHVATEPGQFRMAWIGVIDAQDGFVKPAIFTGEELGYLMDVKIDIHDTTLGRGPTGTAIREGRCIICQDIATDPSMLPWRDKALSRGYRASAAVPFRERGQVTGALTVYSGEPQGFDDEDEELLQQIGLDISFALDSINTEMQRKQAETKLLNQLSFDELMTTLLARFATCAYSEVDDSIEAGLQSIANFLGSDLADLIIRSNDKTSWNSSHRWIAPNKQAVVESSKFSIPSGKLIWAENKLLKGEAIIISSLDDYPPKAEADRQFSEAQGVQAILTIPIRGLGKEVFGCIDIVSYSHPIRWSDSDVVHLKLIGDAIANLLERKRAEESLAAAYDTTLEGWAKALELRDKETEGHSRRVTEATVAVARAMGFEEEALVHIRRGSILHDIGKMGIPDNILRKNGPLTEDERAIVQQHPTTALELLKPIAYLEKAREIPYCHHEKWDGTGYPRGLKGEEIPLAARIFAVVDVWDALSSDRPYRSAWSHEKVVNYLIADSGKHFDPKVLDIFLQMLEKGAI